MDAEMLGKGLPRIDALDKVLGLANYPADHYVAGMLYGKVLFSEHAHARIIAIDTDAARAVPGVAAVFTWKDVPCNEFGINIKDQPVLARDKVRSFGDPVALIFAESEHIADVARKLIRVTYEPLPGVFDPREAMKPGAPLVHEERGSNILKHIKVRKGEVAAGFAHADVIVEGYYQTPFQEHAYLQPEAGLAMLDDQGRIVIYVAAQWPHDDVHQIAHALRLPEDQIREIVGPIGGAFGGREDISIQIFLALGAYLLKRPVKIVYTREESIRGHGKRHPFFMRCRTGATRDGKIIAQDIELISDAGAYASTSIPVLSNAVSFATGPYEVPNVKIDGYTVYTNNPVTMACRGFGANQPAIAYEMQMEKVAVALRMDPVELRLKNVLRNGSIGPLGNVIPSGIGLAETLEKAARAAGWREENGHWIKPNARTIIPASPSSSLHGAGGPPAPGHTRGIGVACSWKNIGFSFGFDDKSRAIAELYLDSRANIECATIKVGVAEVGQGSTTGVAQIAAATLGLPLSCINMVVSDTSVAPDAGSSSASRQLYMSGQAVRQACLAALEKWRLIKEACDRGEKVPRQPIVAEATFRGRDVRRTTPFDPETGLCEPHISYGWVTNVALVDVDTETGDVELLKVWAAQDVGKAINRQLIEQQVDGGVVMGQGYAFIEDFQVDKGRILTRNLTEYLIPTVLDAPRHIEYILVEEPDPTGPYGAKGVGEHTMLAVPPAILAAIHDATGAWIDALPATGERVLAAIDQVRQEQAALATMSQSP